MSFNVLWASFWLHTGASVFQYTHVNLGIDTTVVLTCLDSLLPPLLENVHVEHPPTPLVFSPSQSF